MSNFYSGVRPSPQKLILNKLFSKYYYYEKMIYD